MGGSVGGPGFYARVPADGRGAGDGRWEPRCGSFTGPEALGLETE